MRQTALWFAVATTGLIGCPRSPSQPVARAIDAGNATTTGHSTVASPDAAVIPIGPTGSIEGNVYLDGPIRRGTRIVPEAAWTNKPGCRDAALRYAEPFDVTHPGPFPGALVEAEARSRAPIATVDRRITFRDCDIVPRVMFAREHDRVFFHSDTAQSHLPHIVGSHSTIDRVLFRGQPDVEMHLPGPGRYPVTVRTLPDWVGAVLFVLPNRFIDVADDSGHYRITDVPVGNVLVHAWYPGAAEARQVVGVRANEVAHADFHVHQEPAVPPPRPIADPRTVPP